MFVLEDIEEEKKRKKNNNLQIKFLPQLIRELVILLIYLPTKAVFAVLRFVLVNFVLNPVRSVARGVGGVVRKGIDSVKLKFRLGDIRVCSSCGREVLYYKPCLLCSETVCVDCSKKNLRYPVVSWGKHTIPIRRFCPSCLEVVRNIPTFHRKVYVGTSWSAMFSGNGECIVCAVFEYFDKANEILSDYSPFVGRPILKCPWCLTNFCIEHYDEHVQIVFDYVEKRELFTLLKEIYRDFSNNEFSRSFRSEIEGVFFRRVIVDKKVDLIMAMIFALHELHFFLTYMKRANRAPIFEFDVMSVGGEVECVSGYLGFRKHTGQCRVVKGVFCEQHEALVTKVDALLKHIEADNKFLKEMKVRRNWLKSGMRFQAKLFDIHVIPQKGILINPTQALFDIYTHT